MLGQVGELDEAHATDRAGVRTGRDVSDVAADPGGLKRQMHDVSSGTGQVVTHVQPS